MSDQERMEDSEEGTIRMKVIGVGGAGSNIVDRLMLSDFPGVDLAVVNTDQQALAGSPVAEKLCIGKSITGGLGTGSDVEVGREAALKDIDAIDDLVAGVDLLFLAAGLGGGTGTGAAPVIAEQALRQGAVVIAFVALPFAIERSTRANVAQEGLIKLRDCCNAVVPLPNDLLIQESDQDASLLDAFSKADAWIEKAIKSVWFMINRTGLINIDFSQLRQAFSRKAGKTLFGIGQGSGENAAEDAVADLKLCPLLHTPEFSKLADNLLVNIVGGPRMGIADTQKILESVTDAFGGDANVTFGAVVDEDRGDSLEICVLGTSEVSSISLTRVVRRPRSSKEFAEKKLSPAASSAKEDSKGESASGRKGKPETHARPTKAEQHEFSFSEGDPKGEFENTSGTLFEGQDLDSPTFLRRGVKIAL
ncbi:cell division protein FtsZ [Pelagicoccus sp. SDUM812003]|uniref:cell division protein FtsZ n=1 Tax=Pelagicoccus sp. SDUM812003 TaxID=3041267 RepID=UPI00280D8283|nr:cell division protein FtsZ [Pelagicoccus sp. SDUM812003]MDQ8204418.1 cell division protein FtsZ [Pelagicoccus sp. SDUM812003]